MSRIFCFIILFISLNLSAQAGGTYFVAVDGDDSYPGTFDEPWATWQKAFDESTAG